MCNSSNQQTNNTPTNPPRTPGLTSSPFDGEIVTQIYVDSIPGNWEDHCKRYCDELRTQGFSRVMFHDFPRRSVGRLVKYRRIAENAGLKLHMSFGLDGKRDVDGTPLTATEKGECIGEVLRPENCVEAGTLDYEGQWDTDQGPADDMDEKGALDLGKALRRVAPTAIVMSQDWPYIDMHGDVRRTARPIENGGVFAGSPIDEFAFYAVNYARCRQDYYLNWSPDACFKVTGEMERQWGVVQPALATLGLDRPLSVTLQAYKHKQLHHLAWAILTYAGTKNKPVIMWSMPFPEPEVLAVMTACQKLIREGFARPGVSARDAVRNWQKEYNRGVSEDKKLVEDGWLGIVTLNTLAIKA